MQQQKKMNLIQLTFLVAVNMMGSGIIMLPTNMAKIGAISLLSWIVTALGSMAIAYGFAQAGLFNQRPGGMSAYAEDAYGKPGYFLTFLLYFLSLAIGNVAIAISAVGYLAGFYPWLSSTPIATCIGVIALLWLTTVANYAFMCRFDQFLRDIKRFTIGQHITVCAGKEISQVLGENLMIIFA